MAQQTHIVLIDDLDGKELADGTGETVAFALDGRAYEIDLSDKNAEKLRSVLANYIEHGRKANRANRAKRTQIGPSAQVVRDWARTNGYDVPERGRIPGHIRDAYDAAN